MTIEQKAREIAKAAYDPWDSDFQMRVDAAEAGIIEGVKMAAVAARTARFTNPDSLRDSIEAAILALIDEQKP